MVAGVFFIYSNMNGLEQWITFILVLLINSYDWRLKLKLNIAWSKFIYLRLRVIIPLKKNRAKRYIAKISIFPQSIYIQYTMLRAYYNFKIEIEQERKKLSILIHNYNDTFYSNITITKRHLSKKNFWILTNVLALKFMTDRKSENFALIWAGVDFLPIFKF